MTIIEVTPLDNYTLLIKTDHGQSGLFDVIQYLDSEAFGPLKATTKFKKIRNGGYFVEWECGADLSADTIEARWSKTSPAQQIARALRG